MLKYSANLYLSKFFIFSRCAFLWADGTPINLSALQTASAEKLANPRGILGSPLAGAAIDLSPNGEQPHEIQAAAAWSHRAR
jgi:hypothetical protein